MRHLGFFTFEPQQPVVADADVGWRFFTSVIARRSPDHGPERLEAVVARECEERVAPHQDMVFSVATPALAVITTGTPAASR